MLHVTDDEFDKLISETLDTLPQDRIKGLQNVVITYEDEPSPEQRKKLKLRGNQSLYGLYEGIPLTRKPAASSIFSGNPMVLPDKITIFKLPMLASSRNTEELREQIRHTLWHEIAHYYGLDHKMIERLE